MIAKRQVQPDFQAWNAAQGAPFGRYISPLRRMSLRFRPKSATQRYQGPFAVQENNSTREFEYPWAFHVADLKSGMRVLEIGGGLSGFQFVLDQVGCKVVNIDPGLDATGVAWPCDSASIGRMNSLFGTAVELRNTVVTRAALEPSTFDRAFSISVLEHLPDEEIHDAITTVFEALKPGGRFILTIDLFLNLSPFTTRTENQFGKNVDIKVITEYAPFKIQYGKREELLGFSEFDTDNIMRNLENYLVGAGYPALTQCLVLSKPMY